LVGWYMCGIVPRITGKCVREKGGDYSNRGDMLKYCR
jgi:hypothetical protein